MAKERSANCPTCGQHYLKPDDTTYIAVPLTYDELEFIILRLQESERESHDDDDRWLIDKLRGYLRR